MTEMTQREQGLLCRAAIRQAEMGRNIPPLLLNAIARVESGRSDPLTHRVNPWPWSMNVDGRGYVFDTKAEAVTWARQLMASGVKSFDVGCLQVNMMYHPNAFRDLDEAFDPVANARYAADFLSTLKDTTGSWEAASAAYHSATPELGRAYRLRVEAALNDEAKENVNLASLPSLTQTAMMGVPSMRSLPTGAGRFATISTHFGGAMPTAAGMTGAAFGRPMAVAGGGATGRGLDSYRARPVQMASNFH